MKKIKLSFIFFFMFLIKYFSFVYSEDIVITKKNSVNNSFNEQKLTFIYKNKIIHFRNYPMITENEIYFNQDDFIIFMKTLGFIDWQIIINQDNHKKVSNCTLISNDMNKFKVNFTPLIYEDNIYIPFSSISNKIGFSAVFDYEKGKVYFYPQITNIDIKDDAVIINSSKEIKIQKSFYLNNPLRYVIDIQDSVLSPEVFRQKILSSNEYIYQVRVSQFSELPAITRVVIEINKNQKVKNVAKILPNQLQLIFSDRLPDLYAKKSTYDYNIKNGEEEIKIYQITPNYSGNNISILVQAEKEPKYSINKLDDGRYFIDFYNSILTISNNELQINNEYLKSIKYSQHQLEPFPIVRITFVPQENYNIILNKGNVDITGKLLSFVVKERPKERFNDNEIDYAPFNGITVVIDPGHGGNDSGAVNYNLNIKEKELTLKISLLVKEKLEKMGYRVVLTRYNDQEVTGSPVDTEELQARVNIGYKNNAMLFVSIHINASTYSFANGVMTFYNKDIDYNLANFIHSELIKTDIFEDKGIRQANFYVMKYNKLPAVLLELGFITNYNDALKLMNYENLNKLAIAIAKGIHNYIKANKKS
ncbi:MAG: N-acetylmuramoyl-L-alanine amidase [bacterium]